MRIRLALISTVALVAVCSNADRTKTPAETASAPAPAGSSAAPLAAPKAGLWQQTLSAGPMAAPVTLKICLGATKPDENPFAGPQAPGTDCTQSSNQVAGGVEFHTTCNANGMTVVSDGKVSGALDSAYRVEITSKTTGPNVPAQLAETKTTIDAKRLGDCPAGAEPNSIVQ